MAKLSSAQKAHSGSVRKTLRNKPLRSALKSQIKTSEELIRAGNTAEAQKEALAAVTMLDKAVTKAVIHKNNAARHKSRLMRKLNNALKSKS